jgi:hypothetical protein
MARCRSAVNGHLVRAVPEARDPLAQWGARDPPRGLLSNADGEWTEPVNDPLVRGGIYRVCDPAMSISDTMGNGGTTDAYGEVDGQDR